MSEWLKVVLEEIQRKRREAEERERDCPSGPSPRPAEDAGEPPESGDG